MSLPASKGSQTNDLQYDNHLIALVRNIHRSPNWYYSVNSGRFSIQLCLIKQFALYMVHSFDVWFNNPLPPVDACGTSGMKAPFNGVPNLSILDGWWLEGYTGEKGWTLGDVPVVISFNMLPLWLAAK